MTDGDDQAPGPNRLDIEDLDKLIGAVARREDGAFEQVFEQLSGPVYRMALAVVRDQAQAEEVAQDVLIEMWCTASRYNPGKSSAVAWALMITRRRAIDRVRSATADTKRQRKTAATTMSWDQVSETAGQTFEREHLRCCLDRLSDPQRQAIMLAFYDGYTHADIAVILNVPIGTVKGRIRLALAKLRDCMGITGC